MQVIPFYACYCVFAPVLSPLLKGLFIPRDSEPPFSNEGYECFIKQVSFLFITQFDYMDMYL